MQAFVRAKGFTFIEIMVVVSIVLVLSAIAIVSLSAMQERMLLNTAASGLVFHLEESRSRSVAGVQGQPHGIYFDIDYYVQFRGEEYDPNDSSNTMHEIDPRLELSTDILESEESIIFSRITGTTDESHTITVSLKNQVGNNQSIVVGVGGDITHND
jgi:prepilin-type N-terminal cleavage/methylation domain-containing protein